VRYRVQSTATNYVLACERSLSEGQSKLCPVHIWSAVSCLFMICRHVLAARGIQVLHAGAAMLRMQQCLALARGCKLKRRVTCAWGKAIGERHPARYENEGGVLQEPAAIQAQMNCSRTDMLRSQRLHV
jgi:hypothetical protein